jgi:hypothetical protein
MAVQGRLKMNIFGGHNFSPAAARMPNSMSLFDHLKRNVLPDCCWRKDVKKQNGRPCSKGTWPAKEILALYITSV